MMRRRQITNSVLTVYLLPPQPLRMRDMILTLGSSHKGPSSERCSDARTIFFETKQQASCLSSVKGLCSCRIN